MTRRRSGLVRQAVGCGLLSAAAFLAGCATGPTPCALTPACCVPPKGYFTRPMNWFEGALRQNTHATQFAMADDVIAWVSDTPTPRLAYGRYTSRTDARGKLVACEGTVQYWQSPVSWTRGFASLDVSPRTSTSAERVYFVTGDGALAYLETDFKGTAVFLDLGDYEGHIVDVAVDPGGSGALVWSDSAGGIYACTDGRCTTPPMAIATPGGIGPPQPRFYRRPRISGSRVVFEDSARGAVLMADITAQPPAIRTVDTDASWPDIRDDLIVYSKAHNIPSCNWFRTPHNQIWAADAVSTAPPYAILNAQHWGNNHAFRPRITPRYVLYVNDQIPGKRIVMAYLRSELGRTGVGFEVSESLDTAFETDLSPVERNGMLFFPFRHAGGGPAIGDGILSCSVVP